LDCCYEQFLWTHEKDFKKQKKGLQYESTPRRSAFVDEMIVTQMLKGARGGVVVKALRYKPAGRGFDSRWCHWNFSLT
jgi:hypothetical protein